MPLVCWRRLHWSPHDRFPRLDNKLIYDAIRHRRGDRLHLLFENLDKDGDGFLDEAEFIDALRKVKSAITENVGRRLFRQYDSDGSNRIFFREFEGLVRANEFGVSALKSPPNSS